jgi:acetyl esterase
MARMDLRLRAWGAVTRHQSSVATRSDAEVIALQSRKIPEGGLIGLILGKAAPGVVLTDRMIAGPGGDLPIRVYASAPASSPRPLVVYFHGGGFVFGGLRMGDWICSQVAATLGTVVVGVDYRLAPVHKFPAAVEDCYAAVVWAAANAAELGAEGPLGVMGESAGGNLAAVVCLLGRDRGGPAISHQALIYPATDMTARERPAEPSVALPFLSPEEMAAYRRMYLGPDGDPANPLASPLLAEDHGKLPPALIQVAEHDPLRQEGVRYAAALRAAGVPARLTTYVGMPHGFLNFPGLSRSAPQALAELCAEQTLALATPEELRA